jgi:hypothetical protein
VAAVEQSIKPDIHHASMAVSAAYKLVYVVVHPTAADFYLRRSTLPLAKGSVARQSEIVFWPGIGREEKRDSASKAGPLTVRDYFPWAD